MKKYVCLLFPFLLLSCGDVDFVVNCREKEDIDDGYLSPCAEFPAETIRISSPTPSPTEEPTPRSDDDDDGRICHVPSGNQDKSKTLCCLPDRAVEAHLIHHPYDYVGECEEDDDSSSEE